MIINRYQIFSIVPSSLTITCVASLWRAWNPDLWGLQRWTGLSHPPLSQRAPGTFCLNPQYASTDFKAIMIFMSFFGVSGSHLLATHWQFLMFLGQLMTNVSIHIYTQSPKPLNPVHRVIRCLHCGWWYRRQSLLSINWEGAPFLGVSKELQNLGLAWYLLFDNQTWQLNIQYLNGFWMGRTSLNGGG